MHPVGVPTYHFCRPNNQIDRLPILANRVSQDSPAAVIVTSSGGPGAALAAKAATTTIPIVFAPVPDPVRSGLVASLNRPGGNVTGIGAFTIELDPKRLELLHQLTPSNGPFGVLLNPSRPDTQIQVAGIERAARSVGRELVLGYASSVQQVDAAFASFADRTVVGAGRCRSIFHQPANTSCRARKPLSLAGDLSMA